MASACTRLSMFRTETLMLHEKMTLFLGDDCNRLEYGEVEKRRLLLV